MVPSKDDRHYKLSKADRRTIMWNQTTSRRDSIPQYQNSLTRVDNRVRVCETCGQWFANLEDMRKHIELTHTGSKPVVCEICGKRFGSSQQMVAHYQKHREARLQEFAILKKRRQPDLVSETESESLHTVGSFHRVPKALRGNMSEPYPLPKSYGTDQSYTVSKQAYRPREDKLPMINAEKAGDSRKDLTNLPAISDGTLPMIKGSAVNNRNLRKENLSDTASISLPRLSSKPSVPGPDPGHISVIDNVMGVAQAIETSEESGFVQHAEEELIHSRMEAVALANRSLTPQSFRSRSAVTELTKPKYLVNKEFWDTGSHMTDRLSSYTPVSGYDPNYRGKNSGSVKKRKLTVSLPSIR